MTDLLLALKIAETLADRVPETTIHLKNVPLEYVREYVMVDKESTFKYVDRVRDFQNGSQVYVTVLPF